MNNRINWIREIELKSGKSGNRNKSGKQKRHVIRLSGSDRMVGKMEIRTGLPAHQHEEVAREAAHLMHLGLVFRSMEQWVKAKKVTSSRKFTKQILQDSFPVNLPEHDSGKIPVMDSRLAEPDPKNGPDERITSEQPAYPAVGETWQHKNTSVQCLIVGMKDHWIFHQFPEGIPLATDRTDFISHWSRLPDSRKPVSEDENRHHDRSTVKLYDVWSNKRQIISEDFRWSRASGKFRVLVLEVNQETGRITCRDVDSSADPFTRSHDEFVEAFGFVKSFHPGPGTVWRKTSVYGIGSFSEHGNVVVIKKFDGKTVSYGGPGKVNPRTDDIGLFFARYVPVEYPVSGDKWQNIKRHYVVTIRRIADSLVYFSNDEERFTGKMQMTTFRKHFQRMTGSSD